MGKWLAKRWKGVALVASSFLTGLAGGEALDPIQYLTALLQVLF